MKSINTLFRKSTIVSEGTKSASRVFFTWKNLALYCVNAQIFLMASAKSHGQHFCTFLYYRAFTEYKFLLERELTFQNLD